MGVSRLCDVLGYEIGEGITVNAIMGDKLGVSLKNGVATIFYPRKHLFFRELGVLVENARKSDEFEINEDGLSFFAVAVAVPTATLFAYVISKSPPCQSAL